MLFLLSHIPQELADIKKSKSRIEILLQFTSSGKFQRINHFERQKIKKLTLTSSPFCSVISLFKVRSVGMRNESNDFR